MLEAMLSSTAPHYTFPVASKQDTRKTLQTVIDELLIAKRLGNCRPRYIQELRRYLRMFARGREHTPIASLDRQSLDDWFGSRSECIRTQKGSRGRLSSMFQFAVRHEYVTHDPVKRLEPLRMEFKPPQILSIEQCETLLHATRFHRPRWLPYVVLGLFCGIRPEELDRLTWDSISDDRTKVMIDAAASKVRRRRIVNVPPNAQLWLWLGGPLPAPGKKARHLKFGCRTLGFTRWPQDILRHTCASMALAYHQDAARVAMQLGNSVSILLSHYQELVSAETARQFYSIYP